MSFDTNILSNKASHCKKLYVRINIDTKVIKIVKIGLEDLK